MTSLLQLISALQKCARVAVEDIIIKATGLASSNYPRTVLASPEGFMFDNNTQEMEDPLSWDGILLAGGLGGCPKHKPSYERRKKEKRDLRRWSKYIRSRHMIISCDSCGGYHKKYHLCESCYDQTRYETHLVRKKLNESGLDLSEETVVQYKDEKGRFNFEENKQVLTIDRNRPMGWFSQGLWGK
ncbi:large ribosomal subunit protein bL32m-like [Styela clava]